jgi:hypothetical protein
MKKIIVILIILSTLIPLSNQITIACTVFHVANDEYAFGGNNEDYNIDETYIYFIPPTEEEYGRVIVGYYGPYKIQGGVNEKGLFWDGLATPYLEVVDSADKPYFNGHIIDYILSVSDTCDEAIDILNQYNMKIFERAQILMGDQFGDSFIIEGDIIHKKTEYYQVATNFYLSQYPDPPFPCWRYNTALSMFENNSESNLSVDFCKSVLDAVHQEGAYPTQYSVVYDLKNGLIYLYYFHDYNKVKIFDIYEEFALGAHEYYIPDLFEGEYNPPSKPTRPNGPNNGECGIEYYYTSSSIDPDNDNIYYKFDWDDGTNSNWLGPYSSGASINTSHIWEKTGSYNIKVKAKDVNEMESDWSDPLTISMPKLNNRLLDYFINFLENHPIIYKILQLLN